MHGSCNIPESTRAVWGYCFGSGCASRALGFDYCAGATDSRFSDSSAKGDNWPESLPFKSASCLRTRKPTAEAIIREGHRLLAKFMIGLYLRHVLLPRTMLISRNARRRGQQPASRVVERFLRYRPMLKQRPLGARRSPPVCRTSELVCQPLQAPDRRRYN